LLVPMLSTLPKQFTEVASARQAPPEEERMTKHHTSHTEDLTLPIWKYHHLTESQKLRYALEPMQVTLRDSNSLSVTQQTLALPQSLFLTWERL